MKIVMCRSRRGAASGYTYLEGMVVGMIFVGTAGRGRTMATVLGKGWKTVMVASRGVAKSSFAKWPSCNIYDATG